MNKYVKALLIIITGLLLSLGVNHIFSIPDNFVTTTKVVEKINHDNQNIYFIFQNDKITYSFTEFGDISSEYVLDKINIGDTIIITTEDNVGDFEYTLIQKIEKNGTVIYDSIELYKIHNRNLKLIFIPSIIIISLFLAISCFIKFGIKNNINKYIIRAPKIIFNFFAVSTLIGFIIPFIFLIIYLLGNMPYQTFIYSYVFYLFLALGILGLFIFSKEKLEYDGEYYYVHSMFKKIKIINKSEIKSIVIDRVNKGRKNKSGVYNIDDNRIYMFSFGLICCLKENVFIQSLIFNNVKFLELVLNSKGKIIEKEIKI